MLLLLVMMMMMMITTDLSRFHLNAIACVACVA